MSRRLFWAIPVTLVLVVVARLIIHRLIIQQVEDHHITFDSLNSSINAVTFKQVQIKGHVFQTATIQLLPPLVTIEGTTIDLIALKAVDASTESTTTLQSFSLPSWLPIRLSQIQVQLPFVSDSLMLEGMAHPELQLNGMGLEIERINDELQIQLSAPLTIMDMEGDLNLQAKTADALKTVEFSGSMSNIRLSHPALATKPIQISEINLNGLLKEDQISLSLSTRLSRLSLETQLTSAPQEIQLTDISLHLSDLADWWALTERRKCTLEGELTATGRFTWPDLDWTLQLKDAPFQTECQLFDPQTFQKGVFSIMPLNRKQVYNTGPSTPYWSTNLGWLGAAACAAEDSQFHQHNGIDLKGIQEVLDTREVGQSELRGGSTITQQLAKNLFTGNDRTLHRKLRELIYALELERTFTKDEILRLYLNIVEFGPNIYGIKAASEAYFVKPPAQLLPEEAAYLAALLPSPLSGHSEAIARQFRPFQVKRILTNMKDMKLLSEPELRAAQRRRLLVVPPKPTP